MDCESIDIQLDRVKRHRNKSEWRWVMRASWNNMEEVGDHAIIQSLIRRIAEEYPRFNGLVTVSRGDTPVFHATPIKTWLKPNPFAGKQPEQFKK